VSQARKTSIQEIYQDQTKNLRKAIIQNLHPQFPPHFWKQQEDPVTRVNIILIQASVHKLHFISHDQMPLHKLKHFDCQFQGCA
jgi:hypothetical protein